MPTAHLILGITRKNDDAKGAATGLIFRDGEKLRWTALADLGDKVFYRMIPEARQGFALQVLDRVETTVSGTPRFLFRREGKLEHHDATDLLRFSEANKALLKPQARAGQPYMPLVMAYLEISRLSDLMRGEMLGGERSLGQLAEVLGVKASDEALNETLYELSRKGWMTVHELGKHEDNAIALDKPPPALKL